MMAFIDRGDGSLPKQSERSSSAPDPFFRIGRIVLCRCKASGARVLLISAKRINRTVPLIQLIPRKYTSSFRYQE